MRLKSFITATLLSSFFTCYLFAGEPDSLSVNARLLIKKIQSKHVKPRTVDAGFGNQVHDYFYSFMDVKKEIFRAEDLIYLKGLSAKLDEDIKEGNSRYFSEFNRIFLERTKEIQAIRKTYFSKPVQLNSTKKYDPAMQNKLTTANYKSFWENHLSLMVFSEIVSMHPEDSKMLLKDSLPSFEKRARAKIETNYSNYFELLTGKKMMQEMYLNAIAMSFDPHSLYFSPSQKEGFVEELSTQKEKFGISYGLDEQNRVILTDILPGSSAWLSNELFSGDQILRIRFGWKNTNWLELKNGVAGLKELSEAFKNFQGREITLLVLDKDGMEVQVDLEKTVVYNDNDNIKNALMSGPKNIGYISLPDFYTSYSTDGNELGCANDMAKCILKLKKDGIEGLILDLRGNGGGSLYEAVALSGIFIDYGPILATTDNTGAVQVLKDINRGFIYDGPLMVLIDAGSASASEIVAAVLQDYKKALVVGVPSFGKATSQIVYPLDPLVGDFSRLQENPDYGYANITGGFLYRVTGKSNQGVGVMPDIELGMTAFDSIEERERKYPNALIPGAIDKKMVYTPAATDLPVQSLKAFSEKQRKEGIYATYYQIMDSIGKSYDENQVVTLDILSYWKESQKEDVIKDRLKALKSDVNWTYGIKSNSFDQTVYDKNPILKKYFEDFATRLKLDIELFEAIGIMNEWLQLNK
ncbi:S41 family peptidase [Fluviicola sp.]|uniref:S41 family peptidase n=1 Tax=Fluviicola sp. TaxID=1917219 RepID=UPI0031DF3F9C